MINGCEIGLNGLMRIDMGLGFIMFYCCISKVLHPNLRGKGSSRGMGRFTIMFLCWVVCLKAKRWYTFVWPLTVLMEEYILEVLHWHGFKMRLDFKVRGEYITA